MGIWSLQTLRPHSAHGFLNSLQVVSYRFLEVFFAFDVLLRACVLKLDFFKVPLNYVDVAISAASIVEVAIHYTELPINLAIFRAPRKIVAKVVRGRGAAHWKAHAVHPHGENDPCHGVAADADQVLAWKCQQPLLELLPLGFCRRSLRIAVLAVICDWLS